jgi:hypothetical protein
MTPTFALVIALALAITSPRDAVVETMTGRVEIDWSAGRIRAVGAGAADLRAPGPEVARIGAERRARQDAAARLVEAARALRWTTGTVGEAIDADPAAKQRLEAAAERLADVDVRHFSDGSVEVTLALPLEAVRSALAPPPRPASSEGAPTAIVVDARKARAAPLLGVSLVAGADRYAGPAIWLRDLAAAKKDPRAGQRVVETRADDLAADGALTVTLPESDLAAARNAGALVIVVIEKKR